MKKLMAVLFAVTVFSVTASAANLMIGIKGGVAASDDNVRDMFDGNYSYHDRNGFMGAELGVDLNSESTGRFGIKAGFNTYGKIDTDDWTVNRKVLLKNTITVPVTVYYKWAPNPTGIHLWIGGGATWATLKFQDDKNNLSDTEDQIFPHVAAGIEWRIAEPVAIGLDLNYNFDAKVRSHNMYRDFTGVEGALAVRVYLF